MDVFRSITALCAISYVISDNIDTIFPIIYQTPSLVRSDEGDYFGFSVALHNRSRGSVFSSANWLIIGAPKANSSAPHLNPEIIPEPGVVYKCSFESVSGRDSCEEMILDKTGNDVTLKDEETTYIDRKNHSWIGGTIGIESDDDARTVVCGYRWSNHRFKLHYLMNGVCYWLNNDLDSEPTKLIPLVSKSKQSIVYGYNKTSYYYAYGQAGISLHIPQYGKEFLAGAPGIFGWKGSVVKYSDEDEHDDLTFSGLTTGEDNHYSYLSIPYPQSSEQVEFDELFGYSVGSGYFFNKKRLNYVAGVPRGADGLGKVVIFDFPKNPEGVIKTRVELVGSTLGEFYGYSLAGIDLNSDGLTDLAVGAPFYADKNTGYDVGRLYVYINQGKGLMQVDSFNRMGSQKTKARFAITVMNIGDINHDGYEDLAVGAPYEDDQGAVYIYLGSLIGLEQYASTHLRAKDFSPVLKGFGMGISQAQDMDKNNYPDLAIGSYRSGHTVLFRTRPVISVSGSITFGTNKININSTEPFWVKVCMKYSGNYVTGSLDMINILSIDSMSGIPRGVFLTSSGESSVHTFTQSLILKKETCLDVPAKIKRGVKDYKDAVQVLLKYWPANYFPESKESFEISAPREFPIYQSIKNTVDAAPFITWIGEPKRGRLSKRQAPYSFCKSCPVMDNDSPLSISNSIAFQKNCGDDDICTADLKLNVRFINYNRTNPFIIGSAKEVLLEVNVTNKGEPAYLTSVSMEIPRPLFLVKVLTICQESVTDEIVTLVCEIGNPLRTSETYSLLLNIDVEKIRSGTKLVEIPVSALTASEEPNDKMDDNALNITLYLKTEADLKISGNTQPEALLYVLQNEDGEKETKQKWITLRHRFQITKYEASPIYEAEANFKFPLNITGSSGLTTFARLLRPQTSKSSTSVHCELMKGEYYIPPVKIRKQGQNFDLGGFSPEEGEKENIKRKRRAKRQMEAQKEIFSFANQTLYFNCSSDAVQCMEVRCSVGPFLSTTSFAEFEFTAQISVDQLGLAVGGAMLMHYSSHGSISIIQKESEAITANSRPDEVYLTTVFIPGGPLPGKKVPTWIIAVSIICGILLLSLITAALTKMGFFKRKTKEDLKKLKEARKSMAAEGMDNIVLEDEDEALEQNT